MSSMKACGLAMFDYLANAMIGAALIFGLIGFCIGRHWRAKREGQKWTR